MRGTCLTEPPASVKSRCCVCALSNLCVHCPLKYTALRSSAKSAGSIRSITLEILPCVSLDAQLLIRAAAFGLEKSRSVISASYHACVCFTCCVSVWYMWFVVSASGGAWLVLVSVCCKLTKINQGYGFIARDSHEK